MRLEPVAPAGILSLVLNIVCASLNLVRGVHLMENTFQVGGLNHLIVPLQGPDSFVCPIPAWN